LKGQGYGLGIISNNNDDLRKQLIMLELSGYFDSVTYSQEAGANKPDPTIFQLALKRAGCSPNEAVHVGDSYEKDVLGARRIGIMPILVDRDDHHSEADCLRIRDLREVDACAMRLKSD
jgi:HAD superfamily hydrolase (TIGR01509 family)